MTSQSENQPENNNIKTGGEAWEEVGRQFQTLGESIAAAFRTAVKDETNRQRLEQMRTGLESMVDEVGQAIKETAATPGGQKVKTEAQQAAQKLRTAGEQTIQEARPHLMNALRQLNDELQKMIDRMEKD
jgi:vacuolar-type H+-ATPase subunit E/Vma4